MDDRSTFGAAPRPVLEVSNIRKAFGGNQALAGASLRIAAGEVRALIGQNGCGKSTLVKILSGFYTLDSGEIRLHGEPVDGPMNRQTLSRHGVTFLHQDLGLVPSMSVLENLRIGRLGTSFGRIQWRAERSAARSLLREYGLDVNPSWPVSRLSPTQQTILGMVRALDALGPAERGLIVLDEPTSALPATEIETLFNAIRTTRDRGHGVLLVTHHLDEVFEVADSVSVFRAGRDVLDAATSAVDEQTLVETMIGGRLPALGPAADPSNEPPILVCRGLTGQSCRDVDLDVSPGEIVGLTGLLGAGHEELPYLVYGGAHRLAGQVTVSGQVLRRPDPVRARQSGIALLPANRQRDSGVLTATLRENVSLPSLRSFRRLWGIDGRAERTATERLLTRFDVRPAHPDLLLSALSGGNQQKALLGRWIEQNPHILLLDEPSNGVDVGARQAIFAELQECARRGMAVVVASSQHDDIAAICTRAVVFRRGAVIGELRGPDVTVDRLMSACYGNVAPAA